MRWLKAGLYLAFFIGLGYQGFQHWQLQLTAQETERLQAQPLSSQPMTWQRLNRDAWWQDFTTLASEQMAGRGPTQQGHELAQQYLQQRLQALGVKPLAEHADFRWPFTAKTGAAGVNYLGQIPGQQPGMLVLSAHYDHLGLHKGRTYLGADDNASGVAAVLAIAEYLQQHPPKHTVVIALLDLEEQGLQGAYALFDHAMLDPKAILLNINLDMLSRNTDRQLFAVGSYHYPQLLSLLQQVQAQTSLRLLIGHDRPWYLAGRTPNWTHDSDHAAFHAQQIPFLYFGVPDHPDYHQPTDTWQKADPQFYQQAVETVLTTFLLWDQASGVLQ